MGSLDKYYKFLGTKPDMGMEDYLSANSLLYELYGDFPGLKKSEDYLNTDIVFSPQESKDNRKLEYWPVGETGDYLKSRPTKNLNETLLEILSNKLKQNPDLMKQSIYGDLLHGMKTDPKFNFMRDEFINNFDEKTLDFEKRNGNELNDSRIDAYIRGYLSPDENNEFLKAHEKYGIYSPNQVEILDRMKKYMETGF